MIRRALLHLLNRLVRRRSESIDDYDRRIGEWYLRGSDE